MLPPYIIEELRRREEARREESTRSQLELPLAPHPSGHPRREGDEPQRRDEPQRGVTIIDVF